MVIFMISMKFLRCKNFQPEIFHLAAQALVKKSYLNPIETFQTNSIGTLNMLIASEKVKI